MPHIRLDVQMAVRRNRIPHIPNTLNNARLDFDLVRLTSQRQGTEELGTRLEEFVGRARKYETYRQAHSEFQQVYRDLDQVWRTASKATTGMPESDPRRAHLELLRPHVAELRQDLERHRARLARPPGKSGSCSLSATCTAS